MPRQRFVAALQAEGIPASEGYTVPLYRQGLFTERVFGPYTGYRQNRPDLDYTRVDCPACERASTTEGIWLSQSVLLGSQEDMDSIVAAVTKISAQRRTL